MATQIQEQQVRLIVFDEAHRISREGAKEVNILAGDVFSTLAKISKVELMLVGREELDNLYSGNEELDEMREMDFRVCAIAFPTGVDSAFCKFLSSFEKALPFDRKCDISSLEVAQDIHTYTDGSPGAVALMLQLATKYAILNKVDKLNGPVIGLALAWGKGLKGKRNPFLVRGGENS